MKFVLISKVVRNFVEQKEFSANDIDAIADEVLDGESVHMTYYKDSARQSTGEVSLLDALYQEGRVEEVRKAVFIAIEKHENLLARSSPKEIAKLEEIDFVYNNALCSAIRNDDAVLIANLLQKANQRVRLMYLEDKSLFELKAKDLDFVLTELAMGGVEAAEDVNTSAPLLLVNATAESSVGIIKVLKKHAKKTKDISSFIKPLRSLFGSWHVKPIASALCSIKECIEHKDIESKKLFWKEVNDRVACKDRIYISTNYDIKWGGELMSIRDKVPEINARYIDYNTFIGFMILGIKKENKIIGRSLPISEKQIDDITNYYMSFEPLIDKKTISGLDKINTQLIKEFSEEIKKVIENLILKLSLESNSLKKPRNSL